MLQEYVIVDKVGVDYKLDPCTIVDPTNVLLHAADRIANMSHTVTASKPQYQSLLLANIFLQPTSTHRLHLLF